MKFCQQLSAYYPDKAYGGDRIYGDMIEQAKLCDRLGYESVGITEHHLINILMQPDPLQFAVKIACETSNINILTTVAVLPLHDMRIYAGRLVAAQIFTDNRILVGVGKGAFGFEMGRMGVPLESSREKFDESLQVLRALLNEEEVSWDGKYYQFDPLTIMPRPITPGGPPMMMAVLNPDGIRACAKQGFHIMTTPLAGHADLLLKQVEAFKLGKAENLDSGEISLSLSQAAFIVKNKTDKKEKLQQAYEYFSRFDNVFTGAGVVNNGMVAPLPRKQTLEELDKSILIGSVCEVQERISAYQKIGIDRFILNMNFGCSQDNTLESIARFAEEVMPEFVSLEDNSLTVVAGK